MSDVKRYTVAPGLEDGVTRLVDERDYNALRTERDRLERERDRMRSALEAIKAFDPGNFRPLEDEIKIWRLADAALKSETP